MDCVGLMKDELPDVWLCASCTSAATASQTGQVALLALAQPPSLPLPLSLPQPQAQAQPQPQSKPPMLVQPDAEASSSRSAADHAHVEQLREVIDYERQPSEEAGEDLEQLLQASQEEKDGEAEAPMAVEAAVNQGAPVFRKLEEPLLGTRARPFEID